MGMILVIYGTRPEAIKLAPIVMAARAKGLNVWAHCTNQSPDLHPEAILVPDSRGPLMLAEHLLLDTIRLAVVQGDTSTAFQGGGWAYEKGIPVFHVEAGVRTYDLASPWPEEGYRQMISRIATYHACSTSRCVDNLASERMRGAERYADGVFGVTPHPAPVRTRKDSRFVRVTGSPVVESVRQRRASQGEAVPSSYAVITLHRRENRGHFIDILRGIAGGLGDLGYYWYSHPNGWAVQENTTELRARAPLEGSMFAAVIGYAKVVITDSGGVQEECNALGVPCVVCRTVTDRPESLGAGGAYLGGVTVESVAAAIREALARTDPIDTSIFGDGTASIQVANWWAEIMEAK